MQLPVYFQIRNPESPDFFAMVELAKDIFKQTFAHTVPAHQMQNYLDHTLSEAVISKEILNSESYFFLVLVNDKPVGYIKLNTGDAQTEPRPENQMEIQRFYLHPDYHGKGISVHMMKTVEDFSLLQGKTLLWLGGAEDNLPAVRFYTKQGFIRKGLHPFDFAGEIQWDICMEKKISR